MCGITGIYIFNESFESECINECIKKMTDSIQHRGPDDEGFLAVNSGLGKAYPLTGRGSKIRGESIEDFNKPVDLFLGHRRLAIIDLSEAGHAPMSYLNGNLWITYNGEIYNYLELRDELKGRGHTFQTATDTEVILHAYEEWGIDCLGHFNGMWAFAIVDLRRNRIFCSRDRAGVKPFYYSYDGRRFCFASEIKALLEIDNFSIKPNEQIIADYLFSGLLDHTEQTFFKDICQLRPGEYLLLEGKQLMVRSYWDLEGKEIRFVREEDYGERFYELFQDAIRLRLRSDVPIGTCLSGGLDSSAIVCLANKLIFDGQAINRELVGKRQKTFSSCFENLAYDERSFIETVINHTGAEKNYVFPQPENLFEDLAQITWHQDEPFGSTSIYAQWNVMKLAKERGVTVLLDGQGGDELLAGYLPSFYFLFSHALKKWDLIRLTTEIKGFRKNRRKMPEQFIPRMLAAIVPNGVRPLVQKFMKGGIGWAEKGFLKRYYRNFRNPAKFEHDLDNYLYEIFRFSVLPGLLHYEDRNSMAFSIETRLPFLDYRLVEYIFSLPPEQKIKDGVTKAILRNAMKGTLPEAVRNRKDKMGFVTPEDIWFRTTLRGRIEEILNSKEFAQRGYFDVPKLKQAFISHCEGKRNISFAIWRWVNLELWMRTFLDGRPSSGRLRRDDHTS